MNTFKRIRKLFQRASKSRKMRKRRESVVTVYKKTTKFFASSTTSLLKKMPNKKYQLLTRMVEDSEEKRKHKPAVTSDEDEGDRDLDYYLGVRKREHYWRDPASKEQIRKDFLLYHCGVTEEDYEKCFKISAPKVSCVVQPRFKQVPFKIHKKKKEESVKDDSWREKSLFKLFGKRESDSVSSDSYSEYDSSEETNRPPSSDENEEGVRIKEVSEGRPCDNCPELCPGFIAHAWRKTCKSCGCDRLQHSVYHEELGSVRDRLGLRESRINHNSYDSPPGLTAKQSELYWSSLAERAPTTGGATGHAAWRAWRTRSLASQLPKQDLSLAHCRHIDPVHHKQYEDFVAARNEIALDIGLASQHHGGSIECLGCNKSIRNGSVTVQAPRIGEDAYFHPSCFVCAECDELLVELAYCALDGRLYCVRHYAERLKPRCHACDELFKSCPGAISPIEKPSPKKHVRALPLLECRAQPTMGLVLSAVIAYAGVNDAVECLRHLLSGILPDTDPNFEDLVQYYSALLRKAQTTDTDWTTACGQGYLNLTEDEDGHLKTAAIKYYHGYAPDTTAILFSTKISSFGDSVDYTPNGIADSRNERYSPAKTKTIVTNTSNSFSINNRKSPGADRSTPAESIDREPEERVTDSDPPKDTEPEEKLTWNYTPLSPTPEIQFQTYEDDKPSYITEDYLRSLDGIKYRPLQRSDPSNRRRSFKKRRSSSSTSSKDSRASRDEELKMFTSLEEAEMSQGEGFGSAPNLSAHSYSRSRSRTPKLDRSVEASTDDERTKEAKKLDSFDEDVKEEVIDDVEDFWGNSGD